MKITKKQLANEYSKLENSISGKKIKLSVWLNSLSDRELFVYCVGQTVIYGRSLEDSIKNANHHMSDRERYIKITSGY